MNPLDHPKKKVYETLSVGQTAHNLIHSEKIGRISGISTGGVYLEFSGNLIFLSFFPYRSPITLNLLDGVSKFDSYNLGPEVIISSGVLKFPFSGIQISTQNAEIWKTPRPNGNLLPLPDILCNFRNLVHLIQLINSSEILAKISQLLRDEKFLHQEFEYRNFFECLAEPGLRVSRREFSSPVCLIPLIGFGEGLTPYGDDLIMGFLLAINRWHTHNYQRNELEKINHSIIKAAKKKTTRLSASLIEMASLGMGDERLLNSIDWILSGSPQDIQNALPITSWGNSSGIYALAGMTMAVLSHVSSIKKSPVRNNR